MTRVQTEMPTEAQDEVQAVMQDEMQTDAQAKVHDERARAFLLSLGVPLPVLDGEDPTGEQAIRWGAIFYNAGMDRTQPEEHEQRIEAFHATELLYLLGAAQGSVYGELDLGYVYSYDRGEGHYYVEGAEELFPLIGEEERCARAFRRYRVAAEAGEIQSAYKLGDMYLDGRGVAADPVEACRWYARSHELGKQAGDPVVWGASALRLGRCHEEGLGCEQSFEKALEWYEVAETGLGMAVRMGAAWYERSLTRARDGVIRCKQELSGGY